MPRDRHLAVWRTLCHNTDTDMRVRLHNLICLLVAVAVLLQAVVPMAALADVSVRCAGFATASKPCAHAFVFALNPANITARVCRMPCCHDMPMCRMACCTKWHASTPASFRHMTVGASRKCIVTIKPVGTANSTLTPIKHRWLLRSSPSLAPPTTPTVAETVANALPLRYYSPPELSPPYLSDSHGLRAPPCS